MKVKQISENYESHLVESLPIKGIISMHESEARFINGIIREIKPLKMLEIGVHNGGSSIVMLNAIKDNPNAVLHSVDYFEIIEYGKSYRPGITEDPGPEHNRPIGWAVSEHTPELLPQWKLHTGGHVAKFIEEIGGGIDVCLLDSAHQLPGEILDLLVILPYISKDGIIIQHDTALEHNSYFSKTTDPLFGLTCLSQPVLFAALRSEKWKPSEFQEGIFPTANIGAHQINDDTWRYIDDVLWALNMKWRYLPSDEDMQHVVAVMEKHYEQGHIDMVIRNYKLNKSVGVDKNPCNAQVLTAAAVAAQKKMAAKQSSPEIDRRMQRIEKLTYAGFSGVLGFLSALALSAILYALVH